MYWPMAAVDRQVLSGRWSCRFVTGSDVSWVRAVSVAASIRSDDRNHARSAGADMADEMTDGASPLGPSAKGS